MWFVKGLRTVTGTGYGRTWGTETHSNYWREVVEEEQPRVAGGGKDEKKARRKVMWNIGLQDTQETEGEGEFGPVGGGDVWSNRNRGRKRRRKGKETMQSGTSRDSLELRVGEALLFLTLSSRLLFFSLTPSTHSSLVPSYSPPYLHPVQKPPHPPAPHPCPSVQGVEALNRLWHN